MTESGSAAIIALLLAALPVVAVGLFLVVVVLAIGALSGLMALVEKPPRYWLLAIMVAFNAVVLIPVWLASYLVANSDPAVWTEARTTVFSFSFWLLSPAALFYAWCELKTVRERRRARRLTRRCS